MVDEQKLRELAGAATPGHWTMQHIGRNEWGAEVWTMNNEEIGHSEIAETYTSENAAYMAAANPATTLALLDELQTLRSERTAWRVTAENAEAAVKQARIDAQAQSCVPAVKATDQRVTFDTWLRSVCLQAPPDHAQDLARSAWYASDKQASADCEAMAEEIERLQKALAFWMPDVPSTDHPLYKRVANDVYLLVGFDGPNTEPSAFELGHVALAESHPTLWAIHVPGPDDYYPAPSEEAANHMASKHNAAMSKWNKSNPDTSGNRPPVESSMASAKRWPGSVADHAEEIAVFDYAAWGLAAPQPVAQPGDCEWTNCPNRVGDVCCNEKAKPEAQQAEAQEPVEYQFQDRNGKWRGFLDEQHKLNTIADGTWPIRPLFTRPQPAQHQLCQGERP